MHRQRLFSTLIITSTHAIHSISILPFKFHPHRNASLSHPLPISSPSSTQSIPILPFKNQSSSHCISLILFQSILHHPHSPFPFFLSNSILIALHLSHPLPIHSPSSTQSIPILPFKFHPHRSTSPPTRPISSPSSTHSFPHSLSSILHPTSLSPTHNLPPIFATIRVRGLHTYIE